MINLRKREMTQEKQDETLMSSAENHERMSQEWKEKINRIKAQREQLKLYTADLDLLRQRFNVEKSWLGRIAGGFSSLRWWQKGLIGFAFCGVFALVGLPFGVAWVIALPIIALVFYAGVVLVFENYAKSDRNRFAQLAEGVVLREAEMKESMLEIQGLENELQALFSQLKSLGQGHEEMLSCFQKQSALLASQVQDYQAARERFVQFKDSYGEQVEAMKATEQNFSSDLSDLSKKLSEQFDRIKVNTDDIEQATRSLQVNVASFTGDNQSGNLPEKSPLTVLLEEDFYFRSEEEKLEEKRRIAESDAFFEETDDFMKNFAAFLEQQNEMLHSAYSTTNLKTPSISVLN